MQKLSAGEFKNVIKNTPLVSVDLIIRNSSDQVLLGLRTNAPAKNMWFVPGGRISKNESLAEAFKRISKAETGIEISHESGLFMGIYEHLYPGENFANDPGFGTHYIVMAFSVPLNLKTENLPKLQHVSYKWFTEKEILSNYKIHQNTKNYFNGFTPFNQQANGLIRN